MYIPKSGQQQNLEKSQDITKHNVLIFPKDQTALNATSSDMIEEFDHQIVETGKNIRIDELADIQLEKYAENFRLVKLIEDEKLSPSAAIKRIGAKRSPRAIAYLYKKYQKEGKTALIDQRWCRQPKKTVLKAPMRELILSLYMGFPTGPRGIQRLIKKEIARKSEEENNNLLNLTVPAVSTIHNFIKALPEAVKLARSSRGLKQFQKQGAPYLRYENTSNANERWQLDHKILSIWIRVRRNGKWKAVKVYLTLALDAHSRAITGFWISTKYADTWAIKIMLYFAIRPKTIEGWRVFGVPKIIQCDNGADYISTSMKNTLAALGITMDVDHPYYPNSKGKVERVFRTLDTMLFRILPGHFDDIGVSETSADKRVAELLTRDRLKRELELTVVEYNNTIHSETERKPQELWEETVIGPQLPEEEELNMFLLQYDKQRTIQGFGIRFKFDGEKHLYWHDAFPHHWKEKVTIAYNPESLESVFIYDMKGKLICEAWDLHAENPRYKLSDVKAARKKVLAMLRGLKQRGKDYMEEIWRDDRRIEQRKNYEDSRKKIKNDEVEVVSEIDNKNSELDKIRKLFQQQDTEN